MKFSYNDDRAYHDYAHDASELAHSANLLARAIRHGSLSNEAAVSRWLTGIIEDAKHILMSWDNEAELNDALSRVELACDIRGLALDIEVPNI